MQIIFDREHRPKKKKTATFKCPGIRQARDGNAAVIMCERESSDAACA
mgnify:CR=1 FL=1